MTDYAHGHPVNDRAALAAWMKYPGTEAMDADHDRLHGLLCDLLGVHSHSLDKASGARLTEAQEALAACEEAAVLHVQRWLQWLRVDAERA